MIFGAHESVAGGLAGAFARGTADGAKAIQIFTKASGMWREPVITPDQIAAFRAAHAAASRTGGGRVPVMAHTSYLINLATDDRDLLARSVEALVAEVLRSSALGVDFCVLHPGAHLGAGEEIGVRRTAEALDEVCERTPNATARILIENTAGQGTCVGHRIEHLHGIFAAAHHADRLGICFDTQHAFAAGYDLSTPEGYEKTWRELDAAVGIDKVRAFHLNDSKKPLGSRVDRHEHVGEGNLGLRTFWRLANDPRFASVPGVLETEPREGDTPFKGEVALLRSLVGAPEPPVKEPAPFQLEVVEPKAKKRARA
jgi:deoxyribonuclease-4